MSELVSRARALADEAPAGPWIAEEYDDTLGVGPGPFTLTRAPLGYFDAEAYGACEFIAAARTLVPALCDEIEGLEKLCEDLSRGPA